MTGFMCPHNEQVHILGKCSIIECPYHMNRVQELFDLPSGETDCSHYDTDLMQNVSASRTQISALSRDTRRRLSPKLMRSTYDGAVDQAKTLHSLTHSVPKGRHYCQCCGYPQAAGTLRCTVTSTCKARLNWVTFICSIYQIEKSIIKFQIIWELLFKNEIATSDMTLRTGLSLCNQSDVRNNPNIPKKLLETTA